MMPRLSPVLALAGSLAIGCGASGELDGPATTLSEAAANQVTNGGFESGVAPWHLDVTSPASASLTRDSATRYAGSYSARVAVPTATPATPWYAQLRQDNLALAAGQPVQLAF